MRADRLVAITLMLQSRTKVTAQEVADELEISVRTARRDLEALSMAGIPVYSQAGRNGGWSLIGGATTDLTGLQAPEARALFLAAGQAASSMGSPELKAALRKLTQALPEPFRDDAESAVGAVVVDDTRWGQIPPGSGSTGSSSTGGSQEKSGDAFLDTLQSAVIERRQIRLGYQTPKKGSSVRVVNPLGLVTKAGNWYLVSHTEAGGRTFRLSRVESVEFTGEQAVRPPDFDLAEVWRSINVGYAENMGDVFATGWAAPWTRSILARIVGASIVPGLERDDGWLGIELRSYSAPALAAQIAGLADGLEIVEPVEIRTRLAEIGAELVERYA